MSFVLRASRRWAGGSSQVLPIAQRLSERIDSLHCSLPMPQFVGVPAATEGGFGHFTCAWNGCAPAVFGKGFPKNEKEVNMNMLAEMFEAVWGAQFIDTEGDYARESVPLLTCMSGLLSKQRVCPWFQRTRAGVLPSASGQAFSAFSAEICS